MLADIPGQEGLSDLGTAAGAILAIGALIAAASRTRPFRWLWRYLITNPVGEWFGGLIDHRLAPIHDQFTNNGGSTARDAIDRIETRLDDLDGRLQYLSDGQGDVATSLDAIRDERRDEAKERTERQSVLDGRLAALEAGLAGFAPILDEWQSSHPEVRPHIPVDVDDDRGQT